MSAIIEVYSVGQLHVYYSILWDVLTIFEAIVELVTILELGES